MEVNRRPNRSDVHLSEEEEARVEGETRHYFDELAPKRHSKPQRSEYSREYVDDLSSSHLHQQNSASIPELDLFQQLERDSQRLAYGAKEATEEFVETEYYKDLNCIDKQHHTTGTGFIKVENSGFSLLAPDVDDTRHESCKGNPATNDWTPTPTNMVDFVSDKPGWSDS